MSLETCHSGLCFVAVDVAAPKFFGFSEYLSALALMVVVWTTTDIRYRFRIATAPLPLHRLTFVSITSVGVLTLLTDLWRAEGWLVPRGSILTPAIWQGLLGTLFLLTFLTWAWFAYMKPPIFGKRNAQRFRNYLFWVVMDASPTEMVIVAQELIRSIPSIVSNAPNKRRIGGYLPAEEPPEPTKVQGIANDILLLIGDQRFCRSLVEFSPGTILAVFEEIGETKKYGVSVAQFGRNVVTAAIENPNSFMYHEAEGYSSGLLGYLKPLSQAIFGNHNMAEVVDSLLDPDYRAIQRWSATEWKAYARAVLITLRSYAVSQYGEHSFILHRAFGQFERATSDLYKINGSDGAWDHVSWQRLQASVDFCNEAIKVLNEVGLPEDLHLRVRRDDPPYFLTILDCLVDLIFDIMLAASSVTRPRDLCWSIQHNSVWGHFFGFLSEDGVAGKIVKFKLRRKIYDEIATATDWPNFKNVKILGFCLNVMGLEIQTRLYGRDYRPLQKAVLAWTRRNYASLEAKSPQVFEDCLPDGMSYDKENCRLVRTSEINALRSEPKHFFFELNNPA